MVNCYYCGKDATACCKICGAFVCKECESRVVSKLPFTGKEEFIIICPECAENR
jgi:hypothetical protein